VPALIPPSGIPCLAMRGPEPDRMGTGTGRDVPGRAQGPSGAVAIEDRWGGPPGGLVGARAPSAHGRLLQLLDAISLALCSRLIPPLSGEARGFGQDPIALHNVPRRSWGDRVTLSFRPSGEARITVAPYPFDQDPLDVVIPRKRFSIDGDLRRSAWYAAPQEFVTVQFARA
jgi:hypothetical protein